MFAQVTSLVFLPLFVLKPREKCFFFRRWVAWSRMLSLAFFGQTNSKLFATKLSFEEFNLVFFTAERSVLNQPRQRRFWRDFQYIILYSMVKKNRFFKGNFCIYKGFIDILYILTSASKKNYKMSPDLKLILCRILSFLPVFAFSSCSFEFVSSNLIALNISETEDSLLALATSIYTDQMYQVVFCFPGSRVQILALECVCFFSFFLPFLLQ